MGSEGKTKMGRINFRFGLGSLAKSPGYILQDRGESRVALSCRGARAALSAFAALAAEHEKPDLKSELEGAMSALDDSLLVAQREPSRTFSDLQVKGRLYQELEAIFPEDDDGRVRAFAHDLVAEMTASREGKRASVFGVHNRVPSCLSEGTSAAE